MIFYSKKDLALMIVIWITILAPFISIITAYLTGDMHTQVFGYTLIVLSLFSACLMWIWFKTYYVIDDEQLIIVFGPFKKHISFDSIISIKKSNSLLSSPALSLERIEIMYDAYNMTYISPVNRDVFLKELVQKCPQAKVD